MADIGVFGRYKGFSDFQQEAQANNLKQALVQAQLSKAMSPNAGGALPAALQLANEYESAIANGNLDRANNIAAFAKTWDKGLQQGPDGNYYVAEGYAPAVGEIAATKAGMAQQAKDLVTMQTAPVIAGGKANATNASNLEYAPLIETAKANAKTDTTTEAKVKSRVPLVNALGALGEVSKKAPSGWLSNTYYAAQNLSGKADSEGAKAQGAFQVKRAAAENAIRSAFRVAGSGATSDRDAQPFIEMLPVATDSEQVKAAKIQAAQEAVMAEASALARSRNLPDPFAATDDAASIFGGNVPAGADFRSTIQGAPKPVASTLKPADIKRSIFNARKAIKANPGARNAIIQKLQGAGISTEGL